VLELANSDAPGTGRIAFAAGANATLKLDSGVFASNAIAGLATGDTVGFSGDGSATLARPAAGGLIDMSSGGNDEAFLKSGSSLGATVGAFGAGDKVNFSAVKFRSTDTVNYSAGAATVENKSGVTVASFDVSGTYTKANFLPADDGSGQLVVSFVVAPRLRRSSKSRANRSTCACIRAIC
jgi:hypothetical protein